MIAKGYGKDQSPVQCINGSAVKVGRPLVGCGWTPSLPTSVIRCGSFVHQTGSEAHEMPC